MDHFSSFEAVELHDAAANAAPLRRSVGRFRETPGIKAVRASFAVLCRVAPSLATHMAYELLASPPGCPERAWQARLRESAMTYRLTLGGGELAVYEWGQGPAVLMVHGWGARATHMGKMIEPLVAQGLRVVAFDAPAHGESSGRTTDLVQYAAAVHAVARRVGPLHALLAHSFGVAMALYARRDWGFEAERQVFVSSFDHCRWFTRAFGEHVGLTPQVREQTLQMLVERYHGRLDWDMLSVAEMLRRTPQPTLLIHDRDDAEIPFVHSLTLLKAAPHAQLHETRGLGHHRLLGHAGVIEKVVRFVSHPSPAA